jgi:hypothetical protein
MLVYRRRKPPAAPQADLHDGADAAQSSFFGRTPALAWLHLFYLPLYFFTVLASKVFLDENIGLTDRMLSPILVSLVILLSSLLNELCHTPQPAARWAAALVGVSWLLYTAAGGAVSAEKMHNVGLGIARRPWHKSEAVQALRSLPPWKVYTNSASSLYLWSERASLSLADFETLQQAGNQDPAVLVIFHHIPAGGRVERVTRGLQSGPADQILSVYYYQP